MALGFGSSSIIISIRSISIRSNSNSSSNSSSNNIINLSINSIINLFINNITLSRNLSEAYHEN